MQCALNLCRAPFGTRLAKKSSWTADNCGLLFNKSMTQSKGYMAVGQSKIYSYTSQDIALFTPAMGAQSIRQVFP